MGKFLNADEIFLEALSYPQYARAEFFIKKQIESGWSRDVFLKALKGAHANFFMQWHLLKKKQKNFGADDFEVGESLQKLTKGKVKETYTGHKLATVLNYDVLHDLEDAIKGAKTLGEPEQKFTNLQIISFFERSLAFIRDEFLIQAGEKTALPFSRSIPKGYSPTNANGQKNYLIHHYSLRTPSPLFDYLLLKHTIRDLLLNSRNPDNLKAMLKPSFELCKKIVEIWNTKVFPLETKAENTFRSKSFIGFDTDKLEFTIWTDIERFVQQSNKGFSNEQLGVFAFNAGNLIGNEVLETEDIVEPNKTPDLKSVLKDEKALTAFKQLLEELEITIDGTLRQPKIKPAIISAAVIAVKTTPNMLGVDTITEEELLRYVNNYLGTSVKKVYKRSATYSDTISSAKQVLKLSLQT